MAEGIAVENAQPASEVSASIRQENMIQETPTKESATSNSTAEYDNASSDSSQFVEAENEPSEPNEEQPVASEEQVEPVPKIIRRRLNGYVGFSSLPNQWHRRCVRKGFSFNVMLLGESGSGKATLVNMLLNQDLYEKCSTPYLDDDAFNEDTNQAPCVNIEKRQTEVVENGVKLRLEVLNVQGFGDYINNGDCWQPVVKEIESRFDDYLDAEKRLPRSAIEDNRIHACIFFIQPTGHCLSQLELETLKTLSDKVNLIPIICKADLMTDEEVNVTKERILREFQKEGIKIFVPPNYETDDDETKAENAEIISRIPFAVVASTDVIERPDGHKVRGRSYPWGIVEVDNEDHSDFCKLRQMLIRTHLEELKEKTHVLYENYRTELLLSRGISQDVTVFREINPNAKLEEEKALHEEKLRNMTKEMKAIFAQKVAEKEERLKQSERELYDRHHEMKMALEAQKTELMERKARLVKGTKATHDHEKPKKRFFK
ncbi:septin Spn1 [Schizosaccharomyces japonicus yFS275]|uniref:Septin Spn1 n=1 Tax=Schizosaccharomyces japonicus (strain yFS275 / FY16936) TaxID=402676 RepID=B6K085_SCHJY|nr:septin Spn1 [Schizosaccharomyces japonicus yFS275]EEB06235.1 septin Spn1 [Schizosaccharomyces japonicus yFS275]